MQLIRAIRVAALVLVTVLAGGGVLALSRGPVSEGWQLVDSIGAGSSAQGPPADAVVTAVTAVCAVVLCAVTVWAVLAVAACCREVLRAPGTATSRSRTAPEPPSLLRPRFLQLAVGGVLGVGLVTGPAAYADPAHSTSISQRVEQRVEQRPDRTGVADGGRVGQHVGRGRALLLDGLPLPDRAVGAGRAEGAADAPDRARVEQDPGEPGPVVTVHPGDSLWTITARVLPDTATPAEVRDGWRLLYAANSSVLGPDPDLISPGLRLDVPANLTTPTPGGHP